MKLVLVTGNKIKIAEATEVAREFGVEFEARKIEVEEIQDRDAVRVTQAKARRGYEVAGEPVMVHDSSWEIGDINGFPGAYMHDVAEWFSPADWMRLMAGREDRSIRLVQNIVYFDGAREQVFRSESVGRFVDEPKGIDGNSIDKMVSFSEDGRTLAECHDEAGLVVRDKNMQVWIDFFKWYGEGAK